MKEPKTVKSFLNRISQMQAVEHLRGFEKLSDYEKEQLNELCAMISNQIGELSPELQEYCKQKERKGFGR